MEIVVGGGGSGAIVVNTCIPLTLGTPQDTNIRHPLQLKHCELTWKQSTDYLNFVSGPSNIFVVIVVVALTTL